MTNQTSTQAQVLTPEYKPVVIRMEDITKVYGIANTEVRALNGVSLIVEQGEYC